MDKIHDFIAIGIGPFNLGLACLTDPIDELDGIFLDKSEQFDWHPGMLLEDTTLQIPFIADLVTLADPTSPFSFLNYLKENGRIYQFYIRENFLILRKEYNLYCRWVIEKLRNIHFGTLVTDIEYIAQEGLYYVYCQCLKTDQTQIYRGKKIVLGTGTVPYVPSCCKSIKQHGITHSSSYLFNKEEIQTNKSITILGSGQSAAEIFYDLLQSIDVHQYQLNWITRSPRYFPLEYSKLTLEMTSPEYIDYFYALPNEAKNRLIKNQKHLYKGINNDLISAIYDLLYIKQLSNKIKVGLYTNSELQDVTPIDGANRLDLQLRQMEQGKNYQLSTVALILATGYAHEIPDFVKGIKSRILWDEQGRYAVNRNYSIDAQENEIFVQNAELHTHGFTAPDLGMGCYRNASIIREMTGKEYYAVEKKIAFQDFSITDKMNIQTPTPAEV